jgi:outer membrane protein
MNLSMIKRARPPLAGTLCLAGFCFLFQAANVTAAPANPPPIMTHLPAVLSLKEAVAIALREQPQQSIAKANVDSALGSREQAKSQYFPSVTPSYTFENNRSVEYGISQQQFTTSSISPVTGSGGTGVTTSTVTSPSDAINVIRGGGSTISLKQTLIDSGQREELNAEARHQVESASLIDADTRQQIVANVTAAYYNLLAAQDQVKVAQAQVNENQQTVDLTQAELTAGTAAQTDVYQAKASLATAQVTLIQNQNTVHDDSAALKNAMGVVTDDPVQPESLASGSALPPVPTTPAIASLDQFDQLAQQNRNDLKSQLALVDVQRDAVKLARINAGLSLSADYLLSYQPTNDLGPKGTSSAVTLTASYPLLDGGYSKGAVKIADANLFSVLATFEQTRQAILEAVEQDYYTRQESLQAITYAQVAVQAGQVNYDSAVASREAGVGTVLQITTAEATLTQAQSQYVTAIYNYYIADSNLQRAAGLD